MTSQRSSISNMGRPRGDKPGGHMKVKQLVHNVRVTVTPNTLKTCCRHVQTVVILPNLDKRWDMRPHKGHRRVTVPNSVSMKSQMVSTKATGAGSEPDN